jgi:hypothetical protein
MNLSIEILGYGGAVPVAVAVAVVWVSRRFLPAKWAQRYSLAIALAVAFFVGYVLVHSWAGLVPRRHWQWLPYLGAVAAVLGPAGLAGGGVLRRWLLFLALALVTAWLLVPSWASLWPRRAISVPLLTAYLFLVAALLDALPDRLLGPLAVALFGVVAGTVAVLLAAEVSVKFGQLAGIAAAALAGCWAASLWGGGQAAAAVRGMIPVFAILIGGLAYTGCIEPQPPRVLLLFAPAALLGLWACAAPPLARLRGAAAIAAQIGAVLVPLMLVALCVAFGTAAD